MRAPDDNWSTEVYRLIKEQDITIVATVPDAGLTPLLDMCKADDAVRVITLSTEEEGIGIGYGSWLGGKKALLCMQSSGTGNCINALALPAYHEAPCLMLVTMRGQQGEGNPAQIPMGRGVAPVFQAMGVTCLEAKTAGEVSDYFQRAAELAFGEGKAVAVLIAQQVIGVKAFSK
ncbi:MAG: thiamine pyrophosphate-binding protein [Hyphomicrobiales bacterium]|nr:thiamine pyrophosphate-binding protein [Hyphomicrobiales bacterium]